MKTIKLTIWSLISLFIFVILNWIMHLPTIGMHANDLMRTNVMAALLFIFPLILTLFKLRIGFYILSLVQLIYSVGYISALYQVVLISSTSIINKIIVVLLILIALIINVYWFMLAWKFRKATSKDRIARYMKYRK